jgi:hypothetical protein
MRLPGFTAAECIAGTAARYRLSPPRPVADGSAITPADRGQFIQIEDTLFYCWPCMSGGPAGALVTYCCDKVASVTGGMSYASAV